MLSERAREDIGVQQPGVGDGRDVSLALARVLRTLTGIRLVFDDIVADTVRIPGGVDIALDVRALLLRSVRPNRKLLHEQREDRTDQDRGQHEQCGSERGNPEIAQEDRREKRCGTDHSDGQQDQLGGKHCVDVGEAGAAECRFLARAGEQRVPIEPVGNGLEQHERPGYDRQLDTRGARERALASGESNPTEYVVRHQVGEESEQQRHEQPVQNEPIERQVERVEAYVEAELRVGDAEVTTVEEKLHRNPVRLRDQPGQYAEGYRNSDSEQAQPAHHCRAIPSDRIVRPCNGYEHGTVAVGQQKRQEDDASDNRSDEEEECDSGQHGGRVHLTEVDFAEPKPIRISVDEAGTDEQERCEDQGQYK